MGRREEDGAENVPGNGSVCVVDGVEIAPAAGAAILCLLLLFFVVVVVLAVVLAVVMSVVVVDGWSCKNTVPSIAWM